MSILSTIVFLGFFSPRILRIGSIIFDVITLRYHNSNSLWEYLFGIRLSYISNAFETYYFRGVDALTLLFGSGSYVSFQNPASASQYDTLESDIFDILFMYGLVGVFVYILMFVFGFFLFKKQTYFFVTWGCIFLHSLLAGHVILNGMSLTIIAFLLAIGVSIRPARTYGRSYITAKDDSAKGETFILESIK